MKKKSITFPCTVGHANENRTNREISVAEELVFNLADPKLNQRAFTNHERVVGSRRAGVGKHKNLTTICGKKAKNHYRFLETDFLEVPQRIRPREQTGQIKTL